MDDKTRAAELREGLDFYVRHRKSAPDLGQRLETAKGTLIGALQALWLKLPAVRSEVQL